MSTVGSVASGFWTPVALGVLGGILGVFATGAGTVAVVSAPANSSDGFSTLVAGNEADSRVNPGSTAASTGGFNGSADSQDSSQSASGSTATAQTSQGSSPASNAETPGSSADGGGGSGGAGGQAGSADGSSSETPSVSQTENPPAENQQPRQTTSAGRPLDDIRARSNLLPIAGITADGAALCALPVADPGEVELALEGSEFQDKTGARLSLSAPAEKTDRIWQVEQNAATGLGKPQDCGTFSLQDGQLRYKPGPDGMARLPFCLLKVTAGSGAGRETELCQLWKPLVSKDVPISLEGNRLEQPVIPAELPALPAKSLNITVLADGFGDTDFPDGNALTAEKPVVLEIYDPELAGELLFSAKLSLEEGRSGAVFVISYEATIERVQVRNLKVTSEEETVPFSRPGVEKIAEAASDEIESIQKLVDRRVQPEIEKLEKAIDQQQKNRGSPALARLEKELEKHLDAIDELDEAIIALDNLILWAETAAEVCQDLEGTARIGLKVVRTTSDGHEIPVLNTQLASESN